MNKPNRVTEDGVRQGSALGASKERESRLELSQPRIPPALLVALTKQRLTYCDPTTIYHTVWDSGFARMIGVFGDGANGSYEWFIWDDEAKSLRTSDVGFGCDCVALCCGLVESGANRAHGDHDLFLTWGPRTPTAAEAAGRTEYERVIRNPKEGK